MLVELVEVLLLVVRGALFAGLCWGAWLCLGEQIGPARPAKNPLPIHQPPNHQPLKRFATVAVLLLLLTALGGLAHTA
jgi:hypothetical protein